MLLNSFTSWAEELPRNRGVNKFHYSFVAAKRLKAINMAHGG